MKFLCPKCALPLAVDERGTARCPRAHAYDRSREGYYNLLLSAVGGIHGDNREMIMSRRRFLDTGAYFSLANELSEAVVAYSKVDSCVLDMGCGEGYYTDIVERRLRARYGTSEVLAFDISKDALRMSAKRNKFVSSIVASSYKIPLADESVDIVYNVFSPLAAEETARVLKTGGIFIEVIPNKEHLWELKSAIYENPYKNQPKSYNMDGFELVFEKNVSYLMNLQGHDVIQDLFAMTPYAYRTGSSERARLEALENLECRADFIILGYRKRKEDGT